MELSDKVVSDCKKKIDTTMIGALSAIEDMFGELWNHKQEAKNSKQLDWYNKYEKVRSLILDNGNNQKRKLEQELSKYDIEWKMYHYDFIVKSNKGKEE